MSWLRPWRCALAVVFGIVPLVPVMSAQAAPAVTSPVVATPSDMSPALLAAAQHNEMGPPVMAEASRYEATATVRKFSATAPARFAQTVSNPRLFREVFGFAYASSIGDSTVGYPSWNFRLLSTVAYFGLHVAWNGVLVNDSAMTTWNDASGPVPGLISTAHANGTKVVLTIIMMDSDAGTPNMCSALQYTSNTISQTVAQVVAKHIDGVNVDYESNNATCKIGNTGTTASSQSLFTSFIKSLRAALPSGSYLTVDTYSGSAGYRSGSTYYGFFDISSLASYVDAFFVMAYDMEYSNAYAAPLNCSTFCIGPTAPLTTYLYNDSRASSDYRAVVSGSKVIMGIPYYGRKVCVSGSTPSNAPPNARASGSAAADGYLDASTENGYSANSDYHIHREVNDTAGATRWDTFTSSTANCTRELYWDDTTALGNKYNLIIRDGLRGAGIWTLSYGGGAPELWDLINNKFGKCANATITADHTSPQIPGTSITFTGDAFCAGTAEFRFWQKPPGAAGWTVTQNYSTSNTLTWDTTGQALGTYAFEADARNQGATVSYDTQQQMLMRLALCVTPTLTGDHVSPQLPGTTVTFSATVTCRGTPEYRFWVQTPGGAWRIAQDYGPSSTFVWTGTSYGNYGVEVDVRTTGASVSYESVMSLPFSITSCIGTTLATDKASPQPTGATVTLSATATCAGTNQYRFWVNTPGSGWSIARDYTSSPTFAWTPRAAGGSYGLEVDARAATASASTIVPANQPFSITTCTGATLTTNVAAPQQPGTPITVTGSATCDGTPQYRFWVRPPVGAWAIVQDYGPSATFSWNTTGKPVGFYRLEVDVRNTGATAGYETTTNQEYSIAAQPCTTPTLTPSVASPQATGTAITLTATTSGCPNPIYHFWVQPPGGSWTSVQPYTSSPTFAWNASGIGGAYGLEVDVRDVSRSTLTYDAVANISYTLVACTGAALSTDLASPQPTGVKVTLTGSATCSGTPEYRFWARPSGGTWAMVRDYAAPASFVWDTAGKPGGTYDLEVDVRDHGAASAYETTANGTFTLTPPCGTPSLTPSGPSPQNAGVPVTFTASAGACASPEYRFQVRPPGGVWAIAQNYTGSATFAWGGGTRAGTYGIEVDVRNQGSAVAYDASTWMSYVINPSPACTGAGGVTATPSTAGTGSPVTLTATPAPAGCPTPEYRFWVLPPSGGAWIMVRDYSTSNTYAWPGGGVPGSWRVEVDFRGLGETTAYDVTNATDVTLVACMSATLTADHTSGQARGTTIVFTGAASCMGTPQYRFWIKAPGGAWRIVQDYSPSATFSWSTTGLAAGSYQVEVDIRNQGASASYETVANTTFTLS